MEELVIKAKRSKGEDGYRVFSVRIREDLVRQLDAIAAETRRSRNELVGMLVEYSLQHYKVEPSEGGERAG
jgi:metal-responsive CopG/Arc/MetJ family transcriptional regulator